MKHNFRIIITAALIATVAITGCSKKLDLEPTNTATNETLFKNAEGYRQALAKVYSSMTMVGSNGASGASDLPPEIITDGGSSDFFRNFWYLQCLSTDEAGWTYANNTDPVNIHEMAWTSSNFSVKCMYYRLFYTVTVANNLIIESSDANLARRGITGADAVAVKGYRDEARYVKAYAYWALMDLFGNPPFVDENTPIAAPTLPRQISRAELFAYLETELQSLETSLPDAKTNQYGRVDKAAVWALLSRMYLNAQVYTGTPKFTEAITYCNKITGAGYTLHNNYKELMLADNHRNTDEFIWAINFDGTRTQNFGGTSFLVHGPAGYTADSSGLNGTWDCIRFPQQFVDKFEALDIRGQFWTGGQNKNMTTMIGAPRDGYSSSKFRNKTREGAIAPNVDASKNWADIDLPLFRLAETYLIYAESVARGGSGGSNTTALDYLKALAVRARPNDPSAASYPSLTLNYIIDERARELFWEGHRRTDLIRFDLFTSGTYVWAWKGNVASGTGVNDRYKLYPIPVEDLAANGNLDQNNGY